MINQTEALVAIDINTGKYVGKSARLEDTIVKTNLDAVPEIVRQIRLRDLGGIIVIDFIDMDERKNRYQGSGRAGRSAEERIARRPRYCSLTTLAWWRSPASASSSRWSGR